MILTCSGRPERLDVAPRRPQWARTAQAHLFVCRTTTPGGVTARLGRKRSAARRHDRGRRIAASGAREHRGLNLTSSHRDDALNPEVARRSGGLIGAACTAGITVSRVGWVTSLPDTAVAAATICTAAGLAVSRRAMSPADARDIWRAFRELGRGRRHRPTIRLATARTVLCSAVERRRDELTARSACIGAHDCSA